MDFPGDIEQAFHAERFAIGVACIDHTICLEKDRASWWTAYDLFIQNQIVKYTH